MTLLELVTYFRQGADFQTFCKNHSLNMDSEVIEIYTTLPLHIDNELYFFEIEKTGGKVHFQYDNHIYFNLIDFFYFMDAIEASNETSNASSTDLAISKRLFDYAIHDA
ncbi:hypothetical protein LX64_00703 [Chitinophaga skermanii]|uniref:Uncharacterized protein n=1 Tax=Chitinophaga skermanii TaxID=331697 RepID=A0A327R4F5_9BACT|nr:hypothetical protein [Chitinophaga skermanii]RAJ11095.1 hypothetical protein LX64_00703 [Chitinophaga skermanii]